MSIFSQILKQVGIPEINFAHLSGTDVKGVIAASGVAQSVQDHVQSWLTSEVLIVTPELVNNLTGALVAKGIITADEVPTVAALVGPLVQQLLTNVETQLDGLLAHEIAAITG